MIKRISFLSDLYDSNTKVGFGQLFYNQMPLIIDDLKIYSYCPALNSLNSLVTDILNEADTSTTN